VGSIAMASQASLSRSTGTTNPASERASKHLAPRTTHHAPSTPANHFRAGACRAARDDDGGEWSPRRLLMWMGIASEWGRLTSRRRSLEYG
jgi:hypothetical protein